MIEKINWYKDRNYKTEHWIYDVEISALIQKDKKQKLYIKNNFSMLINKIFFVYSSGWFLYLSKNCTTGSSNISVMSIPRPRWRTSSFFFIINQPTWLNQNPRWLLCGSASVSVYLWWTRWSLTQLKILFCPVEKKQSARIILNGNLALYERCAQRRWAPATIPKPCI